MLDWLEENTKYAKNIGNLKSNVGSLKAGDILIRRGHVEIFAYKSGGTIYVYNCGSNHGISNVDVIGDTNGNRGSYTIYRLTK